MESSDAKLLLVDINYRLGHVNTNLARLLAIFEYLHRDICDELDRKDTR